jgi:predicted DNA-binding WGR domain protein
MVVQFVAYNCMRGGNNMKWNILVKIDDAGNQYKFWAYAVNSQGSPTGEIRFGRIGSIGVKYNCDIYMVQAKIYEKLSKGYQQATEEQIEELFPNKMLMLWEV